MISVNEKVVDFTKFPDGTTSLRFDPSDFLCICLDHSESLYARIEWRYDGDHECMLIWYLVNHIRAVCENVRITLEMPYIPNARMDRVKNTDEVFTLKWFAEFINSMHFAEVFVLDPHSNVATALINRVYVIEPNEYIRTAISLVKDETENDDLLLCYPDEGAAKRYSNLMGAEYIFGIKHRDWRTGKIERLELTTPEKVTGRNVLIVDDICSRGGTFTHTAKALKEVGAMDIYLYVSHCENTIFNGSVLTDGLIRKVFTTNSIYRGDSDMVTVIGG